MSDPELNSFQRLSAVSRDDGVDVDKLSPAELRKYLESKGVKMDAARKRFGLLLKQAKGRQRLEKAAQKREEQIEKIKSIPGVVEESMESVKNRVQALLERLKAIDPGQALIYAREFEKATDEDLLSLEQDLRLLEEDEPPTDKQDKS
jgi:hypothetical protein